MKLVSSLFPGTIVIEEATVTSFVIENKRLFFDVVRDIYMQCGGESGKIILSEDNEVLKIANNVDMITDFVGFAPDQKKVINKINRVLEEQILQGRKYSEAMGILSEIECLMIEAAEIFPFSLVFEGLSVSALVKMSSPKLIDESETELERVLSYMELIRELTGEKLYVMVGMRNFFSDQDMQNFIYTVIAHKYHVLLIESRESAILDKEKRLLIDNDICVI